MASLAAASDGQRWRVDVTLYPYLDRLETDADLTVTINAGLWDRLSYFSYMNFNGFLHRGDPDLARSEQNLRWALSEKLPLDLNLQAIVADGDGNDIWQFGLGWRLHNTAALEDLFDRLNLVYRLTFQLKRVTGPNRDAWQMEHFFRMTFPGISERLYLSGFLDQSFNLDLPEPFPKRPIVTEVQLGLRLFKNFYAVTEYRLNQFRPTDEHNFAAGIEYKFRW